MTTQNTPSGVEDIRSEPVTFQVEGVPIVGELFLPADYDESGVPLASVVCAGTWTSVRQQMTDRYAQKLAAEGLATLSFDFRTYGESGGEPRQIESPQMKARDIIAATEFLGTREEVAADRIGGMADLRQRRLYGPRYRTGSGPQGVRHERRLAARSLYRGPDVRGRRGRTEAHRRGPRRAGEIPFDGRGGLRAGRVAGRPRRGNGRRGVLRARRPREAARVDEPLRRDAVAGVVDVRRSGTRARRRRTVNVHPLRRSRPAGQRAPLPRRGVGTQDTLLDGGRAHRVL